MSVSEIQSAITQLPPEELANFWEWVDELREEEWDRQIKSDAESGKFDALLLKVRQQRDEGLGRPFPVGMPLSSVE